MHWCNRLAGSCALIWLVSCADHPRPATSHQPIVRLVGTTCVVDSVTRVSGRAPVLCAELFIRQSGYTLDTTNLDTIGIRATLPRRHTLGEELAYRHGQLVSHASWECRGLPASPHVVLFRYDPNWVAKQPPIDVVVGRDTVRLQPPLQPVSMTARLDSLVPWHGQVPDSLSVLQRLGCIPVAPSPSAGRQPD